MQNAPIEPIIAGHGLQEPQGNMHINNFIIIHVKQIFQHPRDLRR